MGPCRHDVSRLGVFWIVFLSVGSSVYLFAWLSVSLWSGCLSAYLHVQSPTLYVCFPVSRPLWHVYMSVRSNEDGDDNRTLNE